MGGIGAMHAGNSGRPRHAVGAPSMGTILVVILFTCGVALQGVESTPDPALPPARAADAPAFISISIPDVRRLRAHIVASVYAHAVTAALAIPAIEARWRSFDAGYDQGSWAPPTLEILMQDLASIELSVRGFSSDGIHGQRPQAIGEAELGSGAVSVMSAWARNRATVVFPSPGLDRSRRDHDERLLLVGRSGGRLIASLGSEQLPMPWPIQDRGADISMTIDLPRLDQALAGIPGTADLPRAIRGLGRWRVATTVSAQGCDDVLTCDQPVPWLTRIDRTVLDRMPASSAITLAAGFDGGHAGSALSDVLEFIAGTPAKAADLAQSADLRMTTAGITATLDQLVGSLHGTVCLAVVPSVPFPTLALELPDAPVIDQCAERLLTLAGVAAPHHHGIALVTMPGTNTMYGVAHEHGAWLISGDVAIATAWAAGTPGGWADSPTGRSALSLAGQDTSFIGGFDAPALLRLILGFMALAGGTSTADRDAVQGALHAALAEAGPDAVVVDPLPGGGIRIRDHALIGAGVLATSLVISGLPWLRRQLDRADQASAVARLQTVIPSLVAQRIREHSAIRDGSPGSGPVPSAGGVDTSPADRHQGYVYALYVPDAAGGGMRQPLDEGAQRAAGKPVPGPIPGQTKANAGAGAFVVYAWPEQTIPGVAQAVLSIGPDGIVRASPWTGQPPAWNAVFGLQGWASRPAWTPLPAP